MAESMQLVAEYLKHALSHAVYTNGKVSIVSNSYERDAESTLSFLKVSKVYPRLLEERGEFAFSSPIELFASGEMDILVLTTDGRTYLFEVIEDDVKLVDITSIKPFHSYNCNPVTSTGTPSIGCVDEEEILLLHGLPSGIIKERLKIPKEIAEDIEALHSFAAPLGPKTYIIGCSEEIHVFTKDGEVLDSIETEFPLSSHNILRRKGVAYIGAMDRIVTIRQTSEGIRVTFTSLAHLIDELGLDPLLPMIMPLTAGEGWISFAYGGKVIMMDEKLEKVLWAHRGFTMATGKEREYALISYEGREYSDIKLFKISLDTNSS